MFQIVNVISQTAAGFVVLLSLELLALVGAVALIIIGWKKYQEGQKLRAPLKIRAIRKEVKKGSSK